MSGTGIKKSSCGGKCCKIHPCEQNCDATIPHHMDICGIAGWVWDFCKCPAKAGDKIRLTDCLLAPGHVIEWTSFKVERAEGVQARFELGTDADPTRFGKGDMVATGRGFSDIRELQLVKEDVYLHVLDDVNNGKLVVGIKMCDADPYDGREFMG